MKKEMKMTRQHLESKNQNDLSAGKQLYRDSSMADLEKVKSKEIHIKENMEEIKDLLNQNNSKLEQGQGYRENYKMRIINNLRNKNK